MRGNIHIVSEIKELSYTDRIRTHFAEELPRAKEYREALIAGLAVNSVLDGDGFHLTLSSHIASAVFIDTVRLWRNIILMPTERKFAGKPYYEIACDNEKLVPKLSEILASAGERVLYSEGFMYYIRGLFLASGRISSPDAAEAHLEFGFDRREDAERFSSLLESHELPVPGISKRRNKFVAYFKSRDKLSDILTAADAGAFMFEYLNQSILKSLEWNERRAINFISGNISKAVIAGERQTEECAFMLSFGDGVHLSPELYETAILRVNNPTLSLSELANLHTPAITKSGLNHRLTKIRELAEKYRG